VDDVDLKGPSLRMDSEALNTVMKNPILKDGTVYQVLAFRRARQLPWPSPVGDYAFDTTTKQKGRGA